MPTNQIPIPLGVRYAADSAIKAYVDRGLKNPVALTATCKAIAIAILAKWDINDRKMIRHVTNRMVSYAFDHAYEEHNV